MAVVVAVNVEDRQDIDIHLVEQAGHLGVTAIGGQSLRKNGKTIYYDHRRPLYKHVLCLPYLLDKPLAESRSDPLSGVDATVHEDGRLVDVGHSTELWLLKMATKHLFNAIFLL